MPELPEVETVALQLAPHISGRRVRGLRLYDAKLRTVRPPRVAGATIGEVCRSGKRVLVQFIGQRAGRREHWLAVHLRMTGRLIWVPSDGQIEEASPRARLRLEGGSLIFADTRRFGTFAWYGSKDEARPTGLEPLSRGLRPELLAELIGGSRQAIKVWLLRQDRLVGLGNIYASEILHDARISPLRQARRLRSADLDRLVRSTRKILRRAIRYCGTTFSDFQDADGLTGSYQHRLAVYGRDGEDCSRCRRPIERIVQQQRSTYLCRGCQR